MKKFFLCIVASIALFFVFLTVPAAACPFFNKDNTAKSCVIKAENYTLECGTYRGYETDYDYKAQKPFKKEVIADISKNKITINGISEKFKVKGNKLYIKKTVMYEITGNNRLLMLAGGGIIFERL